MCTENSLPGGDKPGGCSGAGVAMVAKNGRGGRGGCAGSAGGCCIPLLATVTSHTCITLM